MAVREKRWSKQWKEEGARSEETWNVTFGREDAFLKNSHPVLITERSGMKWNVEAIGDLEESSSKGGSRSQIRRG